MLLFIHSFIHSVETHHHHHHHCFTSFLSQYYGTGWDMSRLHLFLSLAISSLMWSSPISSSTPFLQVFFGMPIGLLPSTSKFIAHFTIWPSSLLTTWPNHLNLALFKTTTKLSSPHLLSMEKETNKVLAFLDVCINNKDHCSLLASLYHKKTFFGLLTNFFSFTSYSYKIVLICTLVGRAYKSNNTLATFNDDVKKLFHIFKRN